MTSRALELIPEYVLGTLSEAETREVERALEQSPELRAEAAEVREAFGQLASALPQPAPPPNVKQRLMAAVAGEEKYSPFAIPLARYFDLAVEKVRELLKWAQDPKTTEWLPGPLPGITLLDFDGGPRVATADVGFVRLPRGLHFPWHRHPGYEINFIIEGSIRDYDGRIYGPGEAVEKAAGSQHEFWVGEDQDLLIAVIIEQGFEIIPKPDDQADGQST
jgi:hypothetical protein